MKAPRRRRITTTDDKTEAKRKIIRQLLDQITREIEQAMREANLRCPLHIVVPSRYSLVTIGRPHDVPSDEWARMSAIVRDIVGKKLGSNGLCGRTLSFAMAKATTDAADITPDVLAFGTGS
jgi:hypothetical protein